MVVGTPETTTVILVINNIELIPQGSVIVLLPGDRGAQEEALSAASKFR